MTEKFLSQVFSSEHCIIPFTDSVRKKNGEKVFFIKNKMQEHMHLSGFALLLSDETTQNTQKKVSDITYRAKRNKVAGL